jgi:DNA-binding transcriptional LysR family regulator
VILFERSPAGYALTETGRAMLPAAERAAAEMQSVVDMLVCRRDESHGRIRLTVPDAIDDVLLPLLQQFRRDWPNVQVQMLAAYRQYDLARGEADMAVRVGPHPQDEALLVRPLPPAGWTVYSARGAALPATPEALAQHPLIGGEGRLAELPAFRWLERVAPGAEIVLRCNSLGGVRSAVRTGIGLSPLPCLIGGGDPALTPCFPPIEELTVPFWLVVRRELRRLPHIQALFERIAAHLHAEGPRVRGAA